MKKFICLKLVIIMGLITSCGKDNGGSDAPTPWQKPTYSKSPPIFLTHQNNECNSSIEQTNELFSIHRLIDGVEMEVEINFKNQLRQQSIMSNSKAPISKTYKGVSYSETYFAKFNEETQEYDYLEESNSMTEDKSDIRICSETYRIERDSFENVALNASNSISKTYEKVNAVVKVDLDPIELSVLPIFETLVKYEEGEFHKKQYLFYRTDNAYYHPKEKKVTFLPQSEEFRDKVLATPLWEIPFVASHEYGHHIFSSLFLNNILNLVQEEKISGCFNTLEQHHHAQSEEKAKHDNSAAFAIRSMNEGFADLIADYTLDEKEASLKKVSCFEMNRDLHFSMFGDLSVKSFSKKTLDAISSSERVTADKSCNTPNYQEVHDVGAIFAYNVNYLIEKVTKDKDEKLKILLTWLQNLSQSGRTDALTKDAGEYITFSLELLYKTALENYGLDYNYITCLDIKSVTHENYTCELLSK